jgi:hypothetical protein
MDSDRASFNRAQASNEEPKVEAAVERAARAKRYAFAEERSSWYAVCESSRSAFERTACKGVGIGGRGRLKVEVPGSAVEAYE